MSASVMVVDVGQGDCTVAVDTATGHALIVDCNIGCYEQAIIALGQLGFTEVRAAVVTHSHMDHFGGMIEVLTSLEERFTGVLYLNHDTMIANPGTVESRTGLKGLLKRALVYGDRVSRAHADIGRQQLGDTTSWTLLAPTYPQLLRAVAAGQPNAGSGIVLIESEGRSAIIGGDAQISAWREAIRMMPSRSIVRWPHHGGKIGSVVSADAHGELFQLLDPAAVLVSVGANNNHGHPSPEFFRAAQSHNSQLLCTQVTAQCTGGTPGGVCAGSIRVDLAGSRPPHPTPSEPNHSAFVQQLPNAHCV
ncbi:ComEC/Rec2 family competence protein [Candidatus Poriferisodalis sp.]|uniref:ComEC/Rec2 family competence protein n=1 Tax=Candidatus Poriferisodalis sp. TaxID=3101277 RepID=UPI003B0277EA